MEPISMGFLGQAAASHLVVRVLDSKLDERKRRKNAHELIANTLNRFIEDKGAYLRFQPQYPQMLDYRLIQSAYRLYDDVIMIIVITNGLIDDEITETLRELASHIADIFTKLPYDVRDKDKSSIFEALTQHYVDEYRNRHFPETIDNLETQYIAPILKKIQKIES